MKAGLSNITTSRWEAFVLIFRKYADFRALKNAARPCQTVEVVLKKGIAAAEQNVKADDAKSGLDLYRAPYYNKLSEKAKYSEPSYARYEDQN